MTLRIYTRTGDDGSTGLFGGGRVRKDDARMAACGDIDELNAALGVAATQLSGLSDDRAQSYTRLLHGLQHQLFVVGTTVATPAEVAAAQPNLPRLATDAATQLEAHIDACTAELPPLKQFILPGGSPLSAQLHLARTVCRRAERRLVALQPAADTDLGRCLVLLNRLSDLLFVLARHANALLGSSDITWQHA